jgi:hypothetical protein
VTAFTKPAVPANTQQISICVFVNNLLEEGGADVAAFATVFAAVVIVVSMGRLPLRLLLLLGQSSIWSGEDDDDDDDDDDDGTEEDCCGL